MKILVAIIGSCLLGVCNAGLAATNGYVHFPKMAEEVLAGNSRAFVELLEQAKVTAPGEQLEELAELSSKFVRIAPIDFLRAQAASEDCFGVSFMGPSYTDDPAAKANERSLRRKALESVVDPSLTRIKQRCLTDLTSK